MSIRYSIRADCAFFVCCSLLTQFYFVHGSAYVESFTIDELPKNFCQQALPVVNEDEELSFDAYHNRPGPGSVTYSTAST